MLTNPCDDIYEIIKYIRCANDENIEIEQLLQEQLTKEKLLLVLCRLLVRASKIIPQQDRQEILRMWKKVCGIGYLYGIELDIVAKNIHNVDKPTKKQMKSCGSIILHAETDHYNPKEIDELRILVRVKLLDYLFEYKKGQPAC